MITAETLRALLAQVEEAKAGSRELDIETAKVFGWELNRLHHYWRPPRDWKPLSTIEGVPNFTTSIDAALALVAKVLPGATWAIHPGWGDDIPEGEARGYGASVGGSPDCGGPWTRHDTPPLAIITSLLAALFQQSEPAHPIEWQQHEQTGERACIGGKEVGRIWPHFPEGQGWIARASTTHVELGRFPTASAARSFVEKSVKEAGHGE